MTCLFSSQVLGPSATTFLQRMSPSPPAQHDRGHCCCCCCRVGVVPLFCGHGVGRVFHASPAVMHTPNGEPDVMHVSPPWRYDLQAHTSRSIYLLANLSMHMDAAILLVEGVDGAHASAAALPTDTSI